MSIFSNNVVKKPTRSRFNLGFENKLTCNFGEIVPCMCKEVVPGDIFRCKSEVIVRMMPMLNGRVNGSITVKPLRYLLILSLISWLRKTANTKENQEIY